MNEKNWEDSYETNMDSMKTFVIVFSFFQFFYKVTKFPKFIHPLKLSLVLLWVAFMEKLRELRRI